MNIVLRNNLILITTDFETLNISWMKDFLNHHSRGMLFLPKAVLVFKNETLKEIREEFLCQLSEYYASKHDLSHKFFLRSMLRYTTQPIKIELNELENPETVKVNLYAYDKGTVLISLSTPNSWVINYLRSQLEVYVERGTVRGIFFIIKFNTLTITILCLSYIQILQILVLVIFVGIMKMVRMFNFIQF